jgi:hypothetical protein
MWTIRSSGWSPQLPHCRSAPRCEPSPGSWGRAAADRWEGLRRRGWPALRGRAAASRWEWRGAWLARALGQSGSGRHASGDPADERHPFVVPRDIPDRPASPGILGPGPGARLIATPSGRATRSSRPSLAWEPTRPGSRGAGTRRHSGAEFPEWVVEALALQPQDDPPSRCGAGLGGHPAERRACQVVLDRLQLCRREHDPVVSTDRKGVRVARRVRRVKAQNPLVLDAQRLPAIGAEPRSDLSFGAAQWISSGGIDAASASACSSARLDRNDATASRPPHERAELL